MAWYIRFCWSLIVFIPALVQAATLENPRPGATLSGIGVIQGWKCEAGTLTIRFDGGDPIPLSYGNERGDVRDTGACPGANVGFVSIWNWGLLASGEHTAVVYDDGVEFARSTFTVVRASEDTPYLRDVTATCSVADFPDMGTNARFTWVESAQGLVLQEVGADVIVPTSTQFDGDWELVFTVTEDFLRGDPESVCPCYDGGELAPSVEHGAFSREWTTRCGETDVMLYALISPRGQVESSFGYTEGTWYPVGSLDGFVRPNGTGGGHWFHFLGCRGTWVMRRVDG